MRTIPALAAAAVLAGTLAACSSGPGSITAHGTEMVFANPLGGQSVADAYPDLTSGTQVTVVDSSGKVIGTGTLRYDAAATKRGLARALASLSSNPLPVSSLTQFVAEYSFTVKVPAGQARYGISIGRDRGTIWFSPAQMRKGPSLTLGSLTG